MKEGVFYVRIFVRSFSSFSFDTGRFFRRFGYEVGRWAVLFLEFYIDSFTKRCVENVVGSA